MFPSSLRGLLSLKNRQFRAGYDAAQSDLATSYIQNQIKDACQQLQLMANRRVIAVSSTWEDPYIGILRGYAQLSQFNLPIPIVGCLLRGHDAVVLPCSRVFMFNNERLEAITRLTPYQRMSIMNADGGADVDVDQLIDSSATGPVLLTEKEIRQKLLDRGFNDSNFCEEVGKPLMVVTGQEADKLIKGSRPHP
jgi:hypothetical protein